MRCPECEADIPVPPDTGDAICPGCHTVYELVDDIGWFREFIGVYVKKAPKEES